MKLHHQSKIGDKDTKIHQLQFTVWKLKDNPKVDEFKKEALELNTLLAQQQVLSCQKISSIIELFEKSDSLMNRVADQRIIFDEIDDKVSQYVTCKDIVEGRKANLPRIEFSKK